MQQSGGVALGWVKWMGGAAVVLTLLGLILSARRPSNHAMVATSEQGGPAAPTNVSAERSKPARSGSIPKFQSQPSEYPAERHFRALLQSNRARASGSRIPTNAELYDAEARDPVWASAMERTLTDRFRQNREVLVAAGLKSATIQDPECRTSTCRFEIHYSEQELAQAREAGVFTDKLAPSGYLFQNTGPFARSWSDYRKEPIEVVDGITRMKQIVHVVFGEQESNPGSYDAWVAEARQEMAQQKGLGPKVPTKGLPPLLDVR